MKKQIPLVKDTIDNKDVDQLIEWLKTYPRMTKGPLTVEFEEKWSKWLGTKYSVFVNSGSSANLLMFYALMLTNRLKNKKIVVPALSWATDLAPVLQFGLEPILVDCNLQNLGVDINHLEEIFKKEKPSALILVSVLGLPPQMGEILRLCQEYDVILLEDVCESLGTEYNGENLGNFGLMSSFSLYFGHHLSTIEGGMICTNDKEMYDILKMIRSHGWDRDLDVETQSKLRVEWNINDFNGLYTFYVPGFNVRATDLQAFLGIQQLDKIEMVVKNRERNYNYFLKYLSPEIWKPKVSEQHFVSNFCYPIIHKNRDAIVKTLRENGVEIRPLIAGSMGIQPFYKSVYGELKLPNVTNVDEQGCYIPNNHTLEEEDIKYMCDLINSQI